MEGENYWHASEWTVHKFNTISENSGIHRTIVARCIKKDEEDGNLSTRPKNG